MADSTRALLLREANYPLVHYFPQEDVRMELLNRTDHETHCPYKGDAGYWTLEAGGRAADNAVWSRSPGWRASPATSPTTATAWTAGRKRTSSRIDPVS